MTQEDKQLLLQDLCTRLPYGVKVMVEGWDYDRDCDFTTVETLIGIDDRFIHTRDKTGDKDKHSIVEPLSILDYKPYLRPMSSMTEEEFVYFMGLKGRMLRTYEIQSMIKEVFNMIPQSIGITTTLGSYSNKIDYLNAHHFDYRGLIERGLAIAITEENNPYEN